MKIGFDNDLYTQKQSEHIIERIEQFNNKLYLEFGGKLFDDYHASRVLPGFQPDAKIKLLQKLADKTEIIFVINASAIERRKMRADYGISYDMDVLRSIDNLRGLGIYINSVVISQYSGQPSADIFRKKLEHRGEKVYIHTHTKGYPTDIDTIVSDEGYGANPYIETTRPLVVVSAPGPGSGKLATCLSQLYHEYKRGVHAGYAKFETFPIWNLPLKHPVNLAYEAATADLKDVNMIDPFHLETYGKTTINYNRDIEVFPVVRTILKKITGRDIYNSPTDMGVNMAGYGIFDDEVCREASMQEIVRRYYKTGCEYKTGDIDMESAQKVQLLMNELSIGTDIRKVVAPALLKAEESGDSSMALELPDGRIATGRTTNLMNCCASVALNAIKMLSGIDDDMHLISPIAIEPIVKLKKDAYRSKNLVLNLEEILIALSISAATNPMAELAIQKLSLLKGCEAHSTCMISSIDESIFRKLRVNLTSEPVFASENLYNQ